ncbi:YopX family protein [Streptococcus pyogenes]|uniref:YopX family protein n=1 Tax=Streptococcus pyogenes TaxID=1314 RepID=UPI00373E947A
MIPKFRVWDKSNKKMCDVKALSEFNGGEVTIKRDGENASYVVPIERVILMQSIGLKDKNGVEVFDGDIMFYEQDCYQYTLVKYDKDKLAFVLYDGCERLYHELWGPGEVIGNIYENPELLESVEE